VSALFYILLVMFFTKVPGFAKIFFPPDIIWEIDTHDKKIFLTFDDGPLPEVTPQVLDLLDDYEAKASFFMVGENAARSPALVEEIFKRGHRVGNHGHNHLNGWKTPDKVYVDNVKKAAEHIPSKLFRPPYGKIKPRQARLLSGDFKIVMWSVLSGDFDRKKTPEQCFEAVKNNLKPGAVVVFHDSIKAKENMLPALEKTLRMLKREGWSFGLL